MSEQEQIEAFKEAWHKADDEGRQGERVRDGLREVREKIAQDVEREANEYWPDSDALWLTREQYCDGLRRAASVIRDGGHDGG